jgi:hypothetical protein
VTLKPLANVSGCPEWIRNADGVYDGFHGGSRVMCRPAPTDTDDDYILLLHSDMDVLNLGHRMSQDGWKLGGSKAIHNEGNNIFYSWKLGELNVVITSNFEWFCKMRTATKVCCVLNELSKERRVMIFQAIVYGEGP